MPMFLPSDDGTNKAIAICKRTDGRNTLNIYVGFLHNIKPRRAFFLYLPSGNLEKA
jgi:hypothetical protein